VAENASDEENDLLRKWVPTFWQAFPALPVPAIKIAGGSESAGGAEGIDEVPFFYYDGS
jgi:hypothetical protein